MTIEEAALELNRLAKLAYSNWDEALHGLTELTVPIEISYLRDAVLDHICLLYKPARKPRSSNKV